MSDDTQQVDPALESSEPTGDTTKEMSSVEISRRARRRKLLKGLAVGVPAIITLKSGAALAANSNPMCVQQGGMGSADPISVIGGNRCYASAAAAATNSYTFLAVGDPGWVGGSGPATGAKYCAVYMTAGGTLGTNLNNYGAVSAGTGATATPSATYFAVKDSCWSSFF